MGLGNATVQSQILLLAPLLKILVKIRLRRPVIVEPAPIVCSHGSGQCRKSN
jgi:hypothetical protein